MDNNDLSAHRHHILQLMDNSTIEQSVNPAAIIARNNTIDKLLYLIDGIIFCN